MTIQTETARIVVGAPTVNVLIPFNYPVHLTTELRVICFDGTVAIENTDYQVLLSPPAYGSANIRPLAGLVTKAGGFGLVISRDLPLTQPTPVATSNQILEGELQRALDRAAMRDQQLLAEVMQTIRRPVQESGSAPFVLPPIVTRANKVLGFDANGLPVAVQDIATLVELEAALTLAQGYATTAGNNAVVATTQAGNAATSATQAGNAEVAAELAEALAESHVEAAADILEDIQDFVAGLGSFTRRKFSGFAPGTTVLNIPGGFGNPTTMLVFFDSALLDLTTEYTATSPQITLAQPITSTAQEVTLIEFLAVSITDALIKTQNLSDLTDKKIARFNMDLTKVQNVVDADAVITAGTRIVYTTVAFTASRSFTLPGANAYNAGETIDVYDLAGAISGVNVLTLNRSGADTINGANSVSIPTQRGGIRLASDGVSKWSHAVPTPPVATNGVLIGSSVEWNGPRLPAQYIWENGQFLARTTFSALLNAITLVSTGSTTAGSATITSVAEDLRGLGLVGAKIEGAGIGAGRTIASITATTIVLDASTGNTTVVGTSFRVFPHGNGDGSTTFNAPDCRGRAPVARDDMGGTAAGRVTATGIGNSGLDATVLGAGGGVDRHAIITAELAQHNHLYTDPGHTHNNVGGGGATGTGTLYAGQNANSYVMAGSASAVTGITIANTGSNNAHRNVQPSLVKNKIIYAGV